MSLQTPSKTGTAGDCCVEGRMRVTHRTEAACGSFALRVPHGETSPDAGDRHVRFDERGWETERCRMAQAVAPILDSTEPAVRDVRSHVGNWGISDSLCSL